tara:strand:- start:347 stop:1111 length:765 start_codon:yes stop_codon:yes gene_type:complete
MKEKIKRNIFWSAGVDSTYWVCKKLIIDNEPIETYYLDFPCDGIDTTGWTWRKDMVIGGGRFTRDIEKKVMYNLRNQIIDSFPHTEELFPEIVMVEKVELSDKVIESIKYLFEKYNHSRRIIDQNTFMAQYTLNRKEFFDICYEKDANIDGYSPATRLLREQINDDFTISHSEIKELDIYKYWKFPLSKTYRREMIRTSLEYGFKEILENTWSCRWPSENGDFCNEWPCVNSCIEFQDDIDVDFKRKRNYNNLL